MKIKKIAYLVFIALLTTALADFCQKKTKGFRLQNLYSSDPLQISSSPPSEEERILLKKALSQPYYFLKKGQQCFTFLSKDEKYVIKFLRWEKLEPPFWTKWLRTQKTKNLIKFRKKKKEFDFRSYKIAYEELKEETGVLFLQLELNSDLNIPLTIYDNLGIKHTLKSNEIAFILQKKAENFTPYFNEKVSTGKIEELYPFFSKLIHLLQNRSVKQICDSDITLEYNMGIIDGNPVLFDIGNLSYAKEPLSTKEFIQKQAGLVFTTLNKQVPKLSFFLTEEINKITNQDQENTP